MEYEIETKDNVLFIWPTGTTRSNEALGTLGSLRPHLRPLHPDVVVDLIKLETAHPVALLFVLNAIRKEVALRHGRLRLRSVGPSVERYLKRHRLERLFQVVQDGEVAGDPLQERSGAGIGHR